MKDNNRGLTLVEVLAAVTVLSIIIVVFLTMSQYMAASTQKDDRKIEALQIAENRINQIRSEAVQLKPINHFNLTTTEGGFQIYQEETDAANPQFTVTPTSTSQVSVSAFINMDDSGSTVQKLVTVTVAWEAEP